MEVERNDEGQWHFSLGHVERWVVGCVAAGFIMICAWTTSRFSNTLDSQSAALQVVVTQQAVMNGQLTALSTQLSDVPALRSKVAENAIRIDRNVQDIQEIRAMRGLK